MTFKLFGETEDGFEDSVYIQGDTIEEVREKAALEVKARGWVIYWSENVDA